MLASSHSKRRSQTSWSAPFSSGAARSTRSTYQVRCRTRMALSSPDAIRRSRPYSRIVSEHGESLLLISVVVRSQQTLVYEPSHEIEHRWG